MPDMRMRHPNLENLTAFGLGNLPDEDSQEIETHLTDCEDCRMKLSEVPDDALIDLLRASAAEDSALAFETQAARSKLSSDTDLVTRFGESSTPCVFEVSGAIILPRELEGHPRYDVIGPLGAGGMGTVYKARHRLMDRVVALKIVNPLLVNAPGAAERFTREVKAAAQLSHPNIVTAYDAERVGDVHLLVMEFVEGRTLAQVLAAEGPLPVAKACEYLRQTALGLQHALDRGMVHRDIKPQNLMLANSSASIENSESDLPHSTEESTPVVKILDFGLARFVSEEAPSDDATEQGTLMGSLDYMAPEQGRDAHAADSRADIYGMGCTLYHLLSGRIPFPATSAIEKLEAHRDGGSKPLSQVRSDVPSELSDIVAKMMAKEPAKRYRTPAEVALALRPFTRGDSAPAPRLAPRSSRARRFAAAVFVGLLIVGLGAWAAQVVFRLETAKGTLIVTTDDPDVQISVKSGGEEVAVFFPGQKEEIPLKVGEYTVELVGGPNGLKLSTNKFEIKSANDRQRVQVEFAPAAEAAAAKSESATPEPIAAATGGADRRAAEFVLSKGGKVRVHEHDQEITIAAGLPPDPIRLSSIDLRWNQELGDSDLAHFADLTNLTKLDLASTKVSDVGLAQFKHVENLIQLDLGDTKVSDESLAAFEVCEHLTRLDLTKTQVTDKGLAYFEKCKNLNFLALQDTLISDAGLALFRERKFGVLALDRTRVTDAGLAQLKDLSDLYWLWVADTRVTDAGLACIQNCKEMRYLVLSRTKITDSGLAHLKNLTNLIQFFLDGCDVSDAGLAHFQALENVTGLNLANTRATDMGLAYFKNCKKTRLLDLENTQVSDVGLAVIKDFIDLETLNLKKTKVTRAGVIDLKMALPKCQIDW